MATRTEKILGIITGAGIGAYLANEWLKKNNKTEESNEIQFIIGSILLGSFGGYGLACLIGSPNNTVNYKLLDGHRKVYHGITYIDRVQCRKVEHLKLGKKFTRMIIDRPKPRAEAIKLEKQLIQKDNPKYNIQHKID